jgi:hypothetical protein
MRFILLSGNYLIRGCGDYSVLRPERTIFIASATPARVYIGAIFNT